MDCNPRTPFQWDWENMFNTKEAEMSKPVLQAEWRVEGITNGSEYSSGIAPYSGSEMGNGSPRSSISASVDSSAKIGAVKAAEPRVEAVEGLSTNPSKNKELARVENTKSSPLALATEPLIGLKLGKRTYFEDVCVGNSIKNPSPLGSSFTQSTTLVKKSKMANQKIQAFHCQVEGCNLDLSSSKDYHRKHRVCESHSKCPKVIVAGQECRFCQQCSRFHGLSEFDQKKRSCRRRLSDHNARRRKPQPETISFNSSRLSSSFYDYGQEISFLLNRAPFGQTRPTGGSVPCSFKVSQSKESWIKSTEHRGVDEQLNFTSNELQNTYSTLHHDLNGLLPYKGTTAEVLNQGLGTSVAVPSLDGAPDLRRALSLLSTDSWGPPDPGSTPVQSPNTNQHYEIRPAIIHTPNSAAEYWHDERPLFQEANNQFHLLKSPYESAFFD